MKNDGFVFLLLAAMTLSACGGRQGSAAASRSYAGDEGAFFAAQKVVDSGGGVAWEEAAPERDDAAGAETPYGRKLIRNANIRLRVEDPQAVEGPLSAVMEKYGAYASVTRIFENSRHYTIRVPEASFDRFFAELTGMGRVLERSESAEDVTLTFYDLEGRLATKRELLKTFQSYLGKAQNIDEIMTVEKRIAELQQEIEWTGTELRALADLVNYATVDLELAGPAVSTPGPELGDRITGLFDGFGDFAQAVLVALLGVVVYGIPSVLILAALFWLLLGRVGLLKKLWALAVGPHRGHAQAAGDAKKGDAPL